MKSSQLREIEEILNKLWEEEARLNDWEKDFVNKNLERFEQYGDRTFFSDRQADSVYKMEEKYL